MYSTKSKKKKRREKQSGDGNSNDDVDDDDGGGINGTAKKNRNYSRKNRINGDFGECMRASYVCESA